MVLEAGAAWERVWEGVATIAALAIAAALLCSAGPLPAMAQATLNDALTAKCSAAPARSVSWSRRRRSSTTTTATRVSAVGDVELNYQGRTLQADRVTYDRKTGRVYAEGNARLTEASGAVITGARFELTDDFRNGFIDSLRVEQSHRSEGRGDATRFSAPRAERIEGEQTVFERGTYTACEPCKRASRAPAPVAGQGRPHHPQQQRADDLLRERHARVLRACRSPTCPISGRQTRR